MNHRNLVVWPILMVGLLLGGLFSVGEPPAAEGQDLESSGPIVVRIWVKDRDHLSAVAGELDVWEWHPTKGYAVVAARPEQVRWLEELGYAPEADTDKLARMPDLAPLDPRFHYFDDYQTNANNRYVVDFLQGVSAAHPALTELVDIGDAWLADQPGEHDRDIWVLRLTNESAAFGDITEKPIFFLFANMHAREVAVPELAIRYIKYLLEGYDGQGGYGLDPDATWLLDHNVAYVLVMQNPDGHWMNEQNMANDRRKNMNNTDGCIEPLSWGVDLNRNHSFLWGCCGGSSGSPCSITYRGSSAGSEPETQAFQAYFGTVMPDQNGPNGDNEIPPAAPDDTTGIFASLHAYGDLVLWPWYLPPNPGPPNAAQMETIGRKLATFNGYDPSGDIWYTVDGATDDWTYGKFGVPSFTFEVGPGAGACGGFFPAYGCIDGIDGTDRNFWAENKLAFVYLHKIARTPYMTAYGPDTANVVADPGALAPGRPVSLTATISDERYGTDPLRPIAGAEYFVDAPGEDGTGVPLSASDGAWGGESEEVEAVLDTTGLGPGRHYVLVHGQSEDGDWGPFSAVFVYMVDPAISPTIEGYVRELGSDAPLQATVTANTFQATSDPATGYYSMTVISDTYQIMAVATDHSPASVSGVEVHNHQVHQQDFALEPICTILEDDVESGNLDWTAQSPWAISDEASQSPTHSWTDSPGGDYGNLRSIALTSPVLDLSGYENVTLGFWHIYDIETGYDYGYVEYSTDGGSTWAQAAAYSGYGHTTWAEEAITIAALEDQAQARLRFRFYSDSSLVADGWHVDDVLLTGSGPACTPRPPIAEFGSDSPVAIGNPVRFQNLSVSVPPIDYWWDFGDEAGTSTELHPEYTYASTGTFTVTLVATNTAGSDSISHPVVVEPCVALSGITVLGPAGGEPGTYTFGTEHAPADASLPIDYSWDNGDSADTTVRLLGEGIHTLAVTATNCAASPVSDTHTVTICSTVQGIELAMVTPEPIYPGDEAMFSAGILPDWASLPYSFSVEYDDGTQPVSGSSFDDPLLFTHTFGTTGMHTVEFSAWNCEMSQQAAVSTTLEVMVATCVDLSGINILGPATGLPSTYAFAADLEPTDASLPVAYAWDNGDTASVSTRTLTLGTHTLAVTATNCMDGLVTDTHEITISEPAFWVYVPLVLKDG